LIPVENLINHLSILWDDTARAVEYYHIELEEHDVLLADGAPAESYYDAGNRAMFQNVRPDSQAGDAEPTFAPVLNGGDVVDGIWTRLYERAGGGIEHDTTRDPDLHLVIDGERCEPAAIDGTTYTFDLAAAPAGLRLQSLTGVPSLLGITRHDHRALGVAIRRIELHAPGVAMLFDHDGRLFVDGGCYPPEAGYSWTDGTFELPRWLFDHLKGPFTLKVHTERPGLRYPLAPPAARKAA
jgi:hypothetical protein